MMFNTLKLKIIKRFGLLMLFASSAFIECASSSSMQRDQHNTEKSILQHIGNFVVDHPVLTSIAGGAVSVGVYAFAAKAFDLPNFSDLASSIGKSITTQSSADLEKITSDKLGYACMFVVAAGGTALATNYICEVEADQSGKYSETTKTLCNPFIAVPAIGISTCGLTLAYAAAREHGLPPLYDILQSIGKSVINQISADLIHGAPSDVTPSVKDHLLHGLRVFGYQKAVQTVSIISALMCNEGIVSTTGSQVVETTNSFPPYYIVIIAPIMEEFLCTYLPKMCFDELSQLIGPVLFGAIHTQYNMLGKLVTCCMNLIHQRALIARPEYPLAPMISHMINNGWVLVGFYLLGLLERR